ncbi:hypothetical protein SERLADRAFT_431663 [Serpula lacrymans var. lacrymans S7.9]|uniref:Uncharacterized protein n=1 Tax=Serpula lacrymans var. lacrymans (strain S7.9) TaxID=578457 RepID=F8NDA9_SERL9|nr:uncharacterized protein SERLADRAFT_431663 [Serpula lacrymans var. lacrymans S7.9]EGO30193.1 hypothetical protein SERLADRAFT_431663 [Serpula lacrymans var. lacrymans S7.9]
MAQPRLVVGAFAVFAAVLAPLVSSLTRPVIFFTAFDPSCWAFAVAVIGCEYFEMLTTEPPSKDLDTLALSIALCFCLKLLTLVKTDPEPSSVAINNDGNVLGSTALLTEDNKGW